MWLVVDQQKDAQKPETTNFSNFNYLDRPALFNYLDRPALQDRIP